MKTLKFKSFTYLLCVSLVSFFLSCSKDEPSADNTVNPTFKVNFDNRTWNAASTKAIVNSDYIAISGFGESGDFFTLTVQESRVGTYTWRNARLPNSLALAYSIGNNQVAFIGLSPAMATQNGYTGYTDTAELTISSIDTNSKIISGTFKFTGVRFNNSFRTETKIFTEGQFSVPYSSDSVSPPENKFSAKLDGSNFTPSNINAIKVNRTISIVGRRGNIENIGLTLVEGITVGTHQLDAIPMAGSNLGMYVMDNSGQNVFSSNPGTVTITTHDIANKRIVGTFAFTGKSLFSTSVHQITEGTFDVVYQ